MKKFILKNDSIKEKNLIFKFSGRNYIRKVTFHQMLIYSVICKKKLFVRGLTSVVTLVTVNNQPIQVTVF